MADVSRGLKLTPRVIKPPVLAAPDGHKPLKPKHAEMIESMMKAYREEVGAPKTMRSPLMPAVSLRRALQSPLLPFRRCAFTGKLRWRLVIEYSLVVT